MSRRPILEVDAERRPVGLPFKYKYSLDDFGGNPESLIEDVNQEVARYNSILENLRPGEPHPMHFTDGEYDSRYLSELKIFEQEQALENVQQRHTPPPPPQISVPPDEHALERMKIFAEKREWEEKLIKAEEKGDPNAIDRAKYFRRKAQEDLEKIPMSMFQRQAIAGVQSGLHDMVSRLFDKNLEGADDFWGSERVQHDAEIAMNDFNKLTGGCDIVLPVEKGAFSKSYAPLKPGSVQKITFPSERDKEQFVYHVYQCGADPHEYLRKIGLDGQLRTGDSPPVEETQETKPSATEEVPEKPVEETPRDPRESMDQKTFEAEMEKSTGHKF